MAAWICASCGGENPEGMRFCGHCGAAAAAVPTDAPQVADTLRSFVAEPVAERLVEAGGELPEERRLITALFADVSGFTALADRLDPEELLEVIDPVISGLSSIVGRFDGYVEKFAGDALLALFGAPVSHEDDAERALLVALEMHRELARLCERLPHQAELTLHCGVNSGHGIARVLGSEARMDYAVLGDSVILAQRLESAAPKGETYVSDSTHRLTADRFEFEPVGELELKGKSEAVFAWRLVGEKTAAAPVPRRPLIGRDRELEAVTGVFEHALEGRGAVLLLTGEPGVGKSRLTGAARECALDAGVRWLQSRCLSYGAGLAYWPYAELLRRIAGVAPDTSPEDAVDHLRAQVTLEEPLAFFLRLLGLPSARSDGVAALDPEAFRRGLHDTFAAWISDLCSETPVVVAVEDMHWADASSLELTRELALLAQKRPLVLYLTARPESETALEELLPSPTRVHLEPLDESGITELVGSALEGTPPAGLVHWVIERTTGNPFFVEELVRSLRDHRILERANGGWVLQPGWAEAEVPPTVEGLLASRIDLLPRSAAEVLQAAAVIGRVVPIALLDGVRGRDSAPELELLVARALLDRVADERGPTIAFHHALVQDVAYARLLRRRQRSLHRRVAEVAEDLYGAGDDVLDLLARHLYFGEAGAKAIDYLVRAGERAARLYANQEAIVHLSRAAELAEREPPAAERRLEIVLALADLEDLVGDYEAAERLYATIREETGDVRAWQGIAATLRKRGRYPEALHVLDEASAGELGSAGELALERAWTLAAASRFEDAIDVATAALSVERDSHVRAQLLLQLTRAQTVEGRVEEALAAGREAVSLLEQLGDLRALATALRLLGDAERDRDDLDAAAGALRRGLEIAERVGSVEEVGGCLINLALVELARGSLQDAIEYDRRALAEFERVGHRPGCAIGYTNLAEVLLSAGDLDAALEAVERGRTLAEELGMGVVVADATQTFAAILLERGDAQAAAEQAELAIGLFAELGALTLADSARALAEKARGRTGEAGAPTVA